MGEGLSDRQTVNGSAESVSAIGNLVFVQSTVELREK